MKHAAILTALLFATTAQAHVVPDDGVSIDCSKIYGSIRIGDVSFNCDDYKEPIILYQPNDYDCCGLPTIKLDRTKRQEPSHDPQP